MRLYVRLRASVHVNYYNVYRAEPYLTDHKNHRAYHNLYNLQCPDNAFDDG
jgi:hypothetical protein